MNTSHNIHPTFDTLLQRVDKETLLKQKAKTLWFTGLSGSGKTTLARALERKMHHEGRLVAVLDGDNIRTGISNNLTFSLDDRKENIRRIAEVSKLMNDAGIILLNCFISPTNAIRDMAKSIIGADAYIEIYIKASVALCASRDVKGLYKKAKSGEITNFTGVDAIYEPPLEPAIEIDTEKLTIEQGVDAIFDFVKDKITVA